MHFQSLKKKFIQINQSLFRKLSEVFQPCIFIIGRSIINMRFMLVKQIIYLTEQENIFTLVQKTKTGMAVLKKGMLLCILLVMNISINH